MASKTLVSQIPPAKVLALLFAELGKSYTVRQLVEDKQEPTSTGARFYYLDASVHAVYSLKLFLEYVLDLLLGHCHTDPSKDYEPGRRVSNLLEFTIAMSEICQVDDTCRYLVSQTPTVLFTCR